MSESEGKDGKVETAGDNKIVTEEEPGKPKITNKSVVFKAAEGTGSEADGAAEVVITGDPNARTAGELKRAQTRFNVETPKEAAQKLEEEENKTKTGNKGAEVEPSATDGGSANKKSRRV